MTTWIRGEWIFPRRMVTLWLTNEQLHRHVTTYAQQDPDGMEAYLYGLLAQAEGGKYAGATIHALRYDLAWASWMVLIEHPSLPVVSQGEEAPRMVLQVTMNDLQSLSFAMLPPSVQQALDRQSVSYNS